MEDTQLGQVGSTAKQDVTIKGSPWRGGGGGGGGGGGRGGGHKAYCIACSGYEFLRDGRQGYDDTSTSCPVTSWSTAALSPTAASRFSEGTWE